MKVPPPPQLRLDRAELLRDVRERLGERFPAWAAETPPPSDPAWLLLEQAAWMVELLGEHLQKYPFHVVQQFVHLLGAERRPARPALGVAMVLPGEPGAVESPPDAPPPWRFFTSQTEKRDAIEFTPVEASVPVRPARVASLCEVVEKALRTCGRVGSDTGLGAQYAVRVPGSRSRALDGESVEYTLVSANSTDTLTRIRAAIAEVDGRNLGWLALSAEELPQGRVRIVARVDPARAFARSAPTGLSRGGDLEIDWAPLDETTWTPPIRVADVLGLPPALRGHRPLPGAVEGSLTLQGVPAQLPVAGLIERTATPLPVSVVEQIWSSLARIDTQLAALRPTVRRSADRIAVPGEPAWVAAALASDGWARVAGREGGVIVHVEALGAPAAGALRVALVLRGKREPPVPTAVGISRDAVLLPTALPIRARWTFPVPAANSDIDTVAAYDIELPAEAAGMLLITGEPVVAAAVNALMVANAPPVPDRRDVTVTRMMPEAVSLLEEDVVTPSVLAALGEQPLPAATRAMLARLPLARFTVDGDAPVVDFGGLAVDASLGELMLNAPDHLGIARTFRPGTTLHLEWYRATAGAEGNVETGAITFVEQPPRTAPTLLAVTNIAPTHLGAARESDDACVARVFGPGDALPILPTDWERRVRVALGERAEGWTLRVWTYAERTLVTTRLWPLDGEAAETAALSRELASAGPETLLLVIGSPDQVISDGDLAWARVVVDAEVRAVRERIGAVHRAVVTRFWGLHAARTDDDLRLPAWNTTGVSGTLADVLGRRSEAPLRTTLLNAAVVGVERPVGFAL